MNPEEFKIPLNDPKLPSGWKDLPAIDIPDFTIPVPGERQEEYKLPVDPYVPDISEDIPCEVPEPRPDAADYPNIIIDIDLPVGPPPTHDGGNKGSGTN